MRNLAFDFTEQTVIVTGGARGIGLELGRFFVRFGADVYLMDCDKDEVGKAAANTGARPIHADVSNTVDIDAVVEQIITETGTGRRRRQQRRYPPRQGAVEAHRR